MLTDCFTDRSLTHPTAAARTAASSSRARAAESGVLLGRGRRGGAAERAHRVGTLWARENQMQADSSISEDRRGWKDCDKVTVSTVPRAKSLRGLEGLHTDDVSFPASPWPPPPSGLLSTLVPLGAEASDPCQPPINGQEERLPSIFSFVAFAFLTLLILSLPR